MTRDLFSIRHGKIRVFIEPRDMWVGVYRGDSFVYFCPFPCLVVRWRKRIPAYRR